MKPSDIPNSEFRTPHFNNGDVAQLVEASVSETDRCGFDSLHHHSWKKCGMRSSEFGLQIGDHASLLLRIPHSELRI